MRNPFRKNLRIKKNNLLFRNETHLICEKCGQALIIKGMVYGTEPIFVNRICKRCGHNLFNRKEGKDGDRD